MATDRPGGGIFISYRRDDQLAFAHRLHEALDDYFPSGTAFIDVASIELGRDFRLELERALQRCQVVVAVIGQHWLTVTDEVGRRRLDDPRDFVRLEIEAAIRRDIPVVPVLVDGAAMPPVEALPTSIEALAWRQGTSISNIRFRVECADLVRRLERILAPASAEPVSPPSLIEQSNALPDDHPLWVAHSGLEGHREIRDWRLDDDLDRAQAYYRSVAGKAKVFLDLLIDHPGQRLSVDDVVARTGGVFTNSRSVAGAIAGLYRSHKVSERRYPFCWWEGRPTRYAMKASVAELFRRARANLASSHPSTTMPDSAMRAPSTSRRGARVIGDVLLTAGNVRNAHIYLRSIFDHFPDDVKGGSSANVAADKRLAIDWGGREVVHTDIDSHKKIFRARSWVGEFLRLNEAKAGDLVRVEETAPYQYKVSIVRNC